MSMGTELAKGAWIAPLDDYDEFTDDHIEAPLDECFHEPGDWNLGRRMYDAAERKGVVASGTGE